MARGRLRIYLGAAPGVGTTHSMLDEGRRRHDRGTDVVIAALGNSDRAGLARLADLLERIGTGPDLDVDAVVERKPAVALVDDLAHVSVDGRVQWEQVERLLEEGIDVVTTVCIADVESSRELVAQLLDEAPVTTVPDEFLRGADQIELVDMTPEALRRRLAHGHLHPPERVDVRIANRYRPEVIGGLRRLALIWMTERVTDDLERERHLPAASGDERWPTHERIVVALSGEGGERLVRRAALLAGRVGGELVGLHVVRRGRSPGPDLELQRSLLAALGGSYREVVSDDVADALATFVRIEQAAQLVLGASGRAEDRGGTRSVVTDLLDRIERTEIHVVVTDPEPAPPTSRTGRARPRWRARQRVVAWCICLVLLPAMTAVFTTVRGHVSVGSALLLDLCVVMAVATLGGIVPGVVASVLAFALTNWFLTPPLHTLTVRESENVVALSVFVLVTVVVSVLVDRGARRSWEASVARAEAASLARSAATLVAADDPLPELLDQVRATFGLQTASVLERTPDGWWPTAHSGEIGAVESFEPSDSTSINLSSSGDLRLVVSGDTLRAEQHAVLRAFADQLSMAVEARRLRADAANADLVAEADALRAALLRAVSHDFRTPLATIKASVSGLLQAGVVFSDADRQDLLRQAESAADRLEGMVRDLLDMSRLQAGAIQLALAPVALEEAVAAALSDVRAEHQPVEVDVSETLPMVLADRALVERAIANLVSNALAWSPAGARVRIEAARIRDDVVLRIVDRGPGVHPDDRERMFVPFQRLGDRSHDAGAGLGLAIAKGFIDAMGGRIEVDDTPGGGLTMTIRLAAAPEDLP